MFQHDLDNMPVPICKSIKCESIKIATWNIRTLTDLGKLDNIKQEMSRMNINILGLCEMRWLGAGSIVSKELRIINILRRST